MQKYSTIYNNCLCELILMVEICCSPVDYNADNNVAQKRLAAAVSK